MLYAKISTSCSGEQPTYGELWMTYKEGSHKRALLKLLWKRPRVVSCKLDEIQFLTALPDWLAFSL